MKIIKCKRDGYNGFKAGKNGKCFLGTNAKIQALKELDLLTKQSNKITVSKGITYEPPKRKRKKRTVKKDITNDNNSTN